VGFQRVVVGLRLVHALVVMAAVEFQQGVVVRGGLRQPLEVMPLGLLGDGLVVTAEFAVEVCAEAAEQPGAHDAGPGEICPS